MGLVTMYIISGVRGITRGGVLLAGGHVGSPQTASEYAADVRDDNPGSYHIHHFCPGMNILLFSPGTKISPFCLGMNIFFFSPGFNILHFFGQVLTFGIFLARYDKFPLWLGMNILPLSSGFSFFAFFGQVQKFSTYVLV